ncbi:hypothetical protein [Amycolatopsis viridis]|uniref:ATP-binding protein n=1 Tax=Amycolatopsis viridis TaxID=185678 RepID=A0ABX0SPT2_9PSEU|nr:hypothetical protein [Amycolatopsis viridis]NIH78972.1 hypothetical protein [Amycolatopsis viridis]
MTAPVNQTEIADVRGSVHSGSGDQIDNSTHYYQFLRLVRDDPVPAARRPITAGDLRWLRIRFEPPPGFDKAERVVTGGVVVLSGPTGSGRETAARMLLCPEGEEDNEIHEIDIEAGAAAALGDVEAADRLLVNLSDLDRWTFHGYHRELRSLAAAVEQSGARLAVVINQVQEAWLTDELRRRVVPLGRPGAVPVVLTHLAAAGIDLPPDGVDRAAGEVLEAAAMSELARVAYLVVAESENRRGAAADWLAAAVEAIRGYPGELGQLLDRHRDGRQRALLFAATAFAGARLDTVAVAERTLLGLIGFPEPEQHWLEHDGVVGRLGRLGAEVADRRVGFGRIGYADAVFGRLWDEYAGLHEDLERWIADTVVTPPLADDERRLAGDRLGDQLLRSRDGRSVGRVARSWATQPRSEVRVLAYRLLARAAVDQHVGRAMRRQLYEWAEDPSLPARLAHMILAVCERVLTHTHPDVAIVRLRLLTLHSAPAVSAAAREVLVRLADDARLSRRILAALAKSSRIDHALFAVLAAPHRVDHHPWTRARLIECWRAALNDRAVEQWSPLVQAWLAEAGTRADLLDVLAAAAGDDEARAARLFVVARDWARRADGGAAVFAALRDRIDRQQGVAEWWDDGRTELSR